MEVSVISFQLAIIAPKSWFEGSYSTVSSRTVSR